MKLGWYWVKPKGSENWLPCEWVAAYKGPYMSLPERWNPPCEGWDYSLKDMEVGPYIPYPTEDTNADL